MRFVSCAAVGSPLPYPATLSRPLPLSRTLCRVYCKPMEAIWKSFKYLALKLEMLGRHKRQRQRTNSRSECQKTNCDLLYFSYLLLFFVSCLCVCVFLIPPSAFCVCVLFISDKSTSRASGKCKLRTFPPSFYLSLSFSLCVSVTRLSLLTIGLAIC